jgi:hypothetical protein
VSGGRAAVAISVAIAGLALLSLLLPFTLRHDPSSGLAFRSELWLAIARAGWLASVVLAWRLAARLVFPARTATILATWFAPRRVRAAKLGAGAIAALGIALLFDQTVPWARQFAAGFSEPLLVALVLGAIDRELSRQRAQAIVLGGLAAALWVVPELIGSTDASHAVTTARSFAGLSPSRTLVDAVELPLAALWICAVWAVYSAHREREHAIIVLAKAVLAWIAVAVVLAALGVSDLPRYLAPAGAIACVLGGVGAVRFIAAVQGMRADRLRVVATATAAAVAGAIAIQGAIRAAEIPRQLDDGFDHAEQLDHGHDRR